MKRHELRVEDVLERSERPTIPVPPPARPVSGPVLRAAAPRGSRSLRHAVILLAEKLEALGVDCSDVTAMLGAETE